MQNKLLTTPQIIIPMRYILKLYLHISSSPIKPIKNIYKEKEKNFKISNKHIIINMQQI